jgi:hypothetical protein
MPGLHDLQSGWWTQGSDRRHLLIQRQSNLWPEKFRAAERIKPQDADPFNAKPVREV